MFGKKQKHGTKEYLRDVTLYKYHLDYGRFEIFPKCILYEQTGIRPRELFARGVTKIIGDDNIAAVENKPGKVLARCFENTISFWLQHRDDNEAKQIVMKYICDFTKRTIDDSVRMAEEARRINDIVQQTFVGSINETTFSKDILEQEMNNFVYRTSNGFGEKYEYFWTKHSHFY